MKTVYFFRHNEVNGYLSNWFESPFAEDDMKYSCVEQYIMYQKAKLFGDLVSAKLIMQTNDPAKMKQLGRQVRGFNDDIWNKNKENVALRGVKFKFEQNPNLKEKLLLYPKNTIFAEANPKDKIWGIGFSEKDAEKNKKQWGANLLGKIISRVRLSLAP